MSKYFTLTHDITNSQFSDIFHSFEKFINSESLYKIEEAGSLWKSKEEIYQKYSGYFTPYCRESTGNRSDKKHVIQFCEEFLDVFDRSQIPNIDDLTKKTRPIFSSANKLFAPMIEDVSRVNSSLPSRLMVGQKLPPLALRLIRYEGDNSFGTNLHVDKSAFTAILSTSDPSGNSKLRILLNDRLEKPKFAEGEAIGFYGAAFEEAGYTELSSLPHAVAEIEESTIRYSCVLFWLLPGIDMKKYSTKVHTPGKIGRTRDY